MVSMGKGQSQVTAKDGAFHEGTKRDQRIFGLAQALREDRAEHQRHLPLWLIGPRRRWGEL